LKEREKEKREIIVPRGYLLKDSIGYMRQLASHGLIAFLELQKKKNDCMRMIGNWQVNSFFLITFAK